MAYSDHYQWHDVINVPAKPHISVCELLKIGVVKIKVAKFIVLTNVYFNEYLRMTLNKMVK